MTSNPTPNAVTITRTVDAPIALVWEMWTDPDHFAAWYGPDAATIVVSTIDLQVGGSRRVGMEMQTPDGPMQMWFIGEYRQIAQPTRLVYTEAMSDREGNVLDPAAMGMPADHPSTTEVTVELTDLGERTAMVMIHAGIPHDSPGAAGWAMAFDKLQALVEQLRKS